MAEGLKPGDSVCLREVPDGMIVEAVDGDQIKVSWTLWNGTPVSAIFDRNALRRAPGGRRAMPRGTGGVEG